MKNTGHNFKGVSHKIRKPKISKAKIKKPTSKPKASRKGSALLRPSMITGSPQSSSPGSHRLSSPGMSLLETAESNTTDLNDSGSVEKKFFTSNAGKTAKVTLSKNITLSSENGKISMSRKENKVPKRNVGTVATEEPTDLQEYLSEKTDSVKRSTSVGTKVKDAIPSRFCPSNSPSKENLILNMRTVSKIKAHPNPVSSGSPKRKPLSNRSNPQTPTKSLLTPQKNNRSPFGRQSPRMPHSPRLQEKLRRQLDSPKICSSTPEELYTNTPKKSSFLEPMEGIEEFEPDPEYAAMFADMIDEDKTVLPETPVKTLREEATAPVRRSPRKHKQDLPINNVRYFPIFDPSKRKSDSSLTIKSRKQRSSSKKFQGLGDSQMVIDAGQKNFGATECPTCGLVYEMGDPDEAMSHKEFHDKHIKKLHYKDSKNENQVSLGDKYGGRIIKVSGKDPIQAWNKVATVLEVIDEELGFDDKNVNSREKSYAFLYVLEEKVVGCLIAEDISVAYRVIQEVTNAKESKLLCCSDVPHKAFVGISRIWVLASERRKNIATKLVDAMRKNITIYHQFDVDQFAFSDPTEQGLRFAQKYCGKTDILVYRRQM